MARFSQKLNRQGFCYPCTQMELSQHHLISCICRRQRSSIYIIYNILKSMRHAISTTKKSQAQMLMDFETQGNRTHILWMNLHS